MAPTPPDPPRRETDISPPASQRSQSTAEWAGGRGDKWAAHVEPMEAMLQAVDAPLLQALQLTGPCRIADIGCGGGATSLMLSRAAPAGSSVHGVDVSPALVRAAAARAAGRDGVTFALADAGTAPPPGGPFDRLASRFGVMFFDDPPAAFANLARWLRPGGRLAFAVWGPPAANPWVTTVRDAVAEVVTVPPTEPDAPGLFRYGTAATLVALLERAGFAGVEVATWRGRLPIGGRLSAEAAAQFALAAFAGFGELLSAAGAAAGARALSGVRERFRRHEVDGVVQLDACAHILTGAAARAV